jgi:hypothetical protein
MVSHLPQGSLVILRMAPAPLILMRFTSYERFEEDPWMIMGD